MQPKPDIFADFFPSRELTIYKIPDNSRISVFIPMNHHESEKKYEIVFEDRDEYLYVYVTAERDSYEISHQFWQEIADRCRRDQIKKVLIEENIPTNSSMADIYKLAAELPNMGFYGVTVAFVDRFIEQNDLNQFGELVAVNRGLQGKVFNNIRQAELWLLDK